MKGKVPGIARRLDQFACCLDIEIVQLTGLSYWKSQAANAVPMSSFGSAPVISMLTLYAFPSESVPTNTPSMTAQLETPALTVVLDGAGNASLPAVATGALSVAINGAGNITLGGMASSADLSVEGVGHIDASQLSVSGQTRQDVAGAGVITVKE